MSSSGYVDLNLTATLLVQATGTAIKSGASYSQFGTCTITNNACTLPSGVPSGTSYTIRNDGATGLQVFPPSAGAINGLAANAAYNIPVSSQATFTVAPNSTLAASGVQY